MFCKHKKLKFIKNLYGDHIIMSGYKRSVWKCEDCGKILYRDEYYEHRNSVKIEDIKSNLKNKMPIDIAFPPTENISDGYHSFKELYYQRAILFATICNIYTDKAWKSYRHEDGELCFGGGWFIVGIDTPAGSYTYHYEDKYWDMYDVKVLERGKHWDGHTDNDVDRLLTLCKGE